VRRKYKVVFSKPAAKSSELENLAQILLSANPAAKRLAFFTNTNNRRGTSTVLIRNRPRLLHSDGRPVTTNPNKPSFWIAELSYDLTTPRAIEVDYGKDISSQPEIAIPLLQEATRSLRYRHLIWQQEDLLFLPLLITCQIKLL